MYNISLMITEGVMMLSYALACRQLNSGSLNYLNTNKCYASSEAVIAVPYKYHDFKKSKKYIEEIQRVEKLCSDSKLNTACTRAESFETKGESFSEIYNFWTLTK